MIYEKLIDDYLFGKMSKEQEEQFLKDCKTNPVLKEEATITALLVKELTNRESNG